MGFSIPFYSVLSWILVSTPRMVANLEQDLDCVILVVSPFSVLRNSKLGLWIMNFYPVAWIYTHVTVLIENGWLWVCSALPSDMSVICLLWNKLPSYRKGTLIGTFHFLPHPSANVSLVQCACLDETFFPQCTSIVSRVGYSFLPQLLWTTCLG